MYSRTLLNLALLGLAGVLALVIIYQPGIEPEPLPQTVTTLPADNISRIAITRKAHDPLLFTRRGGKWFLNAGNELRASEFQVNSILATLQASVARSYPVDTVDPEALGLKPPLALLTLDDTPFKIGATEPLDKLRYLQVGDTVFLVTDRYQHLISADWPGFVSRKLLPASATISQLQLPQVTLSLTADNQWQQSTSHAPLAPEHLQTLVDRWQQASATYTRRYRQAASEAAVTVKFSNDAEPINFQILQRTPELVLARPELGIQYHLQGALDTLLPAIPAD